MHFRPSVLDGRAFAQSENKLSDLPLGPVLACPDAAIGAAKSANIETQMPSQSAMLGMDPSERRRSQRFLHIVPLVVRGESPERKGFWEDTFTVSISAHGALIILAAKVGLGQTLVLMNPQNWDERDVRVTRIGSFDGKLAQVGIEFVNPAPEFWPGGAPPRKSFGR